MKIGQFEACSIVELHSVRKRKVISMSDLHNLPDVDPEGIEQAEQRQGRRFDNHNDLSDADPNRTDNEALISRQINEDQDEMLLPGSEPGGMEIEGGNEPDSDDGGLSGIRPSEDDEIDNSGKISRGDMAGL